MTSSSAPPAGNRVDAQSRADGVSNVASRRKIAFLTNLLAPSRVPIFERLARQYDLVVMYSGRESNREAWDGVQKEVRGFKAVRVSGLNLAWTKRVDRGALDARHLHVELGLFGALLRLRPDAIITGEMGFRSTLALAYGRLFRCPVWVWWGGTSHTERGIGPTKRLFRRWFVGQTSRWLSYGVTSTEYLLSLGVPAEKVVELQNCVPEYAYTEAGPPLLQLDVKPVLLSVGRLVPAKGVDLFLEAAARLQEEGLKFSVLIVGGGPEKRRLEHKAAALGLRDMHLHPAEPHYRMASVYRSADVLVFPTLDDVWGLVANEALWSGLPALVSIYAGCAKELVAPESTFDPLDPADFTAKLRRAVTGQLPRPDLTRLKRISEVSDRLLDELDRALGEP
jgi:glycosyltransferase involved in cell wall biosynthesis